MSTTYKFSMYVQVSDEQSLHDAAYTRGLAEGVAEESIYDMLGTRDEPDVSSCLRMMFDPGESPSGTEILDSEVE